MILIILIRFVSKNINIEIKCAGFNKKGKKITASEKLIDVTECAIQRPKNSELQVYYYSGKKKKKKLFL